MPFISFYRVKCSSDRNNTADRPEKINFIFFVYNKFTITRHKPILALLWVLISSEARIFFVNSSF